MFPLLAAACLCSAPCEKLHHDVALSFGAYGGTVSEYVWQGNGVVSRLDWQQYAVPQATVSGRLGWHNAYAGASLATAIPFACGIMEDFDFLLEDSSAASQYSRHDVYLDKRYDVAVFAGYEFSFLQGTVFPALTCSYRNQKWSARDGYLQYPASGAWTGDEAKTTVQGNIISYEQSLLIPAVALHISWHITDAWTLRLQGSFSPYLVAETLDSHFLRNKQFYDTMSGGYGFSIGAGAQYKRCAVFAAYEYMRVMHGDTASGTIGIANAGVTNDADYGSGIKSRLWRITCSFLM